LLRSALCVFYHHHFHSVPVHPDINFILVSVSSFSMLGRTIKYLHPITRFHTADPFSLHIDHPPIKPLKPTSNPKLVKVFCGLSKDTRLLVGREIEFNHLWDDRVIFVWRIGNQLETIRFLWTDLSSRGIKLSIAGALS
jgi:hypothetical protein